MFYSILLPYVIEEGILRDTDRVEDGIRTVDSPKIVTNASNIARRANRVLQVAQSEAENSEDPAFVDNVNRASEQLRSSELQIKFCVYVFLEVYRILDVMVSLPVC